MHSQLRLCAHFKCVGFICCFLMRCISCILRNSCVLCTATFSTGEKNSGPQKLQTLPVAGAFRQPLTKMSLPNPQTCRLHPTKRHVWLQSIHLSFSLANYRRRAGFFATHLEFHQQFAAVHPPTSFRGLGLAFLGSPSPPSCQSQLLCQGLEQVLHICDDDTRGHAQNI